ncbi:P27 family phage terminase small subunit [Lysinibacillus sp. RC79]|uniref:P27 family phage terminase small subunit n=1 Tax=Lysinibacillus sp. RC79 TaxID=3156296 RepID=UPI003517AD01
MKYKDIAGKYNVKENTVKSWYKRYKWKEKKEQCTQESGQEAVTIAPEIVELVPGNKKLRRRIEKDLREQLFEMGATQAHFMDLFDDYLAMWDVKNMLIEDIQERGVTVPGARGEKKNDSIGELNKTNAQMLKILSELGLKTSEIKIEGEDDDNRLVNSTFINPHIFLC